MAGRVQQYTHSDSTTESKGVAVIKVSTETDFAARTEPFIAFTKRAAMMAYGALPNVRVFVAGADMWKRVIELFPDLEAERLQLQHDLRERVAVIELAIIRL